MTQRGERVRDRRGFLGEFRRGAVGRHANQRAPSGTETAVPPRSAADEDRESTTIRPSRMKKEERENTDDRHHTGGGWRRATHPRTRDPSRCGNKRSAPYALLCRNLPEIVPNSLFLSLSLSLFLSARSSGIYTKEEKPDY